MTEPYKTLFAPSGKDEAHGLINEEPARYCLAEAGLKDKHPEDYAECLKIEDEDLRNIAITCMAIEKKDVKYCDADHGAVPLSMYSSLLAKYEPSEELTNALHGERFERVLGSKELMTNFGFVFRIAVDVLARKSEAPKGRWYAANSCPRDEFLFRKGYRGNAEKVRSVPALCSQLGRFARNSSTLGNYSLVPKSLDNESNLNPKKGCLQGSLRAFRESMHVNDQFALFAKWIEEYCNDTNRATSKDKLVVEGWQQAMLLDGEEVWGRYKKAAGSLKEAFWADDPSDRILKFVKYLTHVNEAIEARSRRIVREFLR